MTKAERSGIIKLSNIAQNSTGKGNESAVRKAYAAAYEEIRQWEKQNRIYFRQIFHASGTGMTQGGLVAGFLDEAMGWAHVIATEGAEAPLNLDINMTLLKPVLPGPLLAKGRVVRRGKRVIFLEGELFDESGAVLARSTSTAIPTPRPSDQG